MGDQSPEPNILLEQRAANFYKNVVPASLCTHIVREIQALFAAGRNGCFDDGCYETATTSKKVTPNETSPVVAGVTGVVLHTGTSCRRRNGSMAISAATSLSKDTGNSNVGSTCSLDTAAIPRENADVSARSPSRETMASARNPSGETHRIAMPVIATDVLALLRTRKLLPTARCQTALLPNACDIFQYATEDGSPWQPSPVSIVHAPHTYELLVTLQGSQHVELVATADSGGDSSTDTGTGSGNGIDTGTDVGTGTGTGTGTDRSPFLSMVSSSGGPGHVVCWHPHTHLVHVSAVTGPWIGMHFYHDDTLNALDLSNEGSEGGALRKKNEKKRRRERKAAARVANMQKSGAPNASMAIVPIGAMKSVPIPWDLLSTAQELQDPKIMPSVEVDHVKNLYNAIAPHWHYTRFKAWPKVEEFVLSLPPGSLVGDIGCGNGKNIPACGAVGFGIGCDISVELVKICLERGFETLVADTMNLPYRTGMFDATLSIAVLHHVSTVKRRVQALAEITRVLTVGGKALIYAWAFEQKGAKSGHKFGSQDVFVPWHFHDKSQATPHKEQQAPTGGKLRNQGEHKVPLGGKAVSVGSDAEDETSGGDTEGTTPSDAMGSDTHSSTKTNPENTYVAPLESTMEEKVTVEEHNSTEENATVGETDTAGTTGTDRAHDTTSPANDADTLDTDTTGDAPPADTPTPQEGQVYQRYCHVYRKGELEYLASMLHGVEPILSYYDTKTGEISVHLRADADK